MGRHHLLSMMVYHFLLIFYKRHLDNPDRTTIVNNNVLLNLTCNYLIKPTKLFENSTQHIMTSILAVSNE